MKFTDIFGYSASSLRTQKGRSFLTVLGVVIGIAAIVALNSMTAGMEVTINAQLEEGLSANTLTVSSGGLFAGFGGGGREDSVTMYINDTIALESIDHVDEATALIQKQVSYPINGNINGTTTIYGIDFETYAKVYTTFSTADGGFGSIPTDSESFVIGYGLYETNIEGMDTLYEIGENLTISWDVRNESGFWEHYEYTANVSGVLAEIGGFTLGGGPSDRTIFLPIDKMRELFDTEEVDSIILLIDESTDEIIEQIEEDVSEYFGNDMTVTNPGVLLGTMTSVIDTMSLFITGIAAISLVVAGIGIMNIMTVSVLERTREIGILKAVGTKDRTVLLFFLFEALIVGIIGSVVGILIGYIGANFLGQLLGGFAGGNVGPGGGRFGGSSSGITPILTLELVGQALLFGILVSVIFGLYPAYKASRKLPVDALRYV